MTTMHYSSAGRHLEDALRTISDAAQLYPDSRGLAHAHAELLARCGHDAVALKACEAFLLRFGVDGELLDTALSLRNLIGPYTRLAEEGSDSISLCMIVKDEERHLPRCLDSIRPAVHEMIVVDTGSTDRTRDIATLFGARLFDFPWNGSFSEARNHGIDQAKGRWILLLDADEVLSVRDHASIAQTSASAGMQAFSVLTRNYTRQVNAQGWTPNDGSYPDAEAADGWKPSWKVRLFPNDPRFRFRGEVHEMVETSLREAGIMIRQAPFVVHHYGELEEDPGRLAAKRQRYFEIGRRKLEANPDDLTALAELAVQAGELGNFAEAITLWDRLLSSRPDNVEALFNKGYNLMMLKRYEESLVASQQALELDPDLKEAAFNLATCKLYTGAPEEGIVIAEEYVSRYPDYPLLNAILVALYLATGDHEHAFLGAEKLVAQNYSISQYIRERADVLATQGYTTLADRLRTGIVVLDNHTHPKRSDEKQNSRQQR